MPRGDTPAQGGARSQAAVRAPWVGPGLQRRGSAWAAAAPRGGTGEARGRTARRDGPSFSRALGLRQPHTERSYSAGLRGLTAGRARPLGSGSSLETQDDSFFGPFSWTASCREPEHLRRPRSRASGPGGPGLLRAGPRPAHRPEGRTVPRAAPSQEPLICALCHILYKLAHRSVLSSASRCSSAFLEPPKRS